MKQEAKAAQIPIYARKVTDPLGASEKTSRKGGLPPDQLTALFPNGGWCVIKLVPLVCGRVGGGVGYLGLLVADLGVRLGVWPHRA